LLVAIEGLPEDTREHIEQIGAADIVIGLAGAAQGEPIAATVTATRQAVQNLSGSARTVIVHPNGNADGARTTADNLVGDNIPVDNLTDDAPVRLLACPLPVIAAFPEDVSNLSEAFRTIFFIARGLGARACWVLSSQPGPATTEAFQRLVEPLLLHNLDVVVPSYALKKSDGLINSSIVYPLTRALYGKQIHAPMSPDVGVSARFIDTWLRAGGEHTRAGGVLLMAPFAAREGFQVGQVYLGPRPPTAKDVSDLSTVLSHVLSALFADIENTAAIWQRTRGSQPIPSFGKTTHIIDDEAVADVRRLIEAFQLGYKNLLEVWGRFLPPDALVELKKLTRSSVEKFRLPDEYWARIVYDCALGYRLRVISRDHLLRSMTPIYLAWVASWIVEVQHLGAAAVAERLERLCTAYEQQKSYLVSRWRWPERFSR
jgi:glucosylglycerate synthase